MWTPQFLESSWRILGPHSKAGLGTVTKVGMYVSQGPSHQLLPPAASSWLQML